MQLDVAIIQSISFLKKLGAQILLPADSLIDWDLATAMAFDVAGPQMRMDHRAELNRVYLSAVEAVTPLVAEFMEQDASKELNPVIVFDRKEWILANIENMKAILSPLSENYWEVIQKYISVSDMGSFPERFIRKTGRMSITTEIAVLTGYLSRKVLAQYDWGIITPEGSILPKKFLYFVEPNISDFEEAMDLNPASVRLWIALHEVTHSFQFERHVWIREYMRKTLNDYFDLTNHTIENMKNKLEQEGQAAFKWQNLLTEDHKKIIRKIQSLMALMEGYSDFVMMEAGRHLPDHEKIAAAVQEKRQRKNWAEQLIQKMIGFNVKAEQYVLGERFVSYVAKKRGRRFVNLVWQDQDALPTMEEIKNPENWIKRMK